MLKRKAFDNLKRWKEEHKNNCLLVIGARQVGKTFIIREFVKKNYKYELNIITTNNFSSV